MMPRLRTSLLTAALVFAACDSKVDTQVDESLLNDIEAVSNCLPGLFGHVQALLDVADTWRLRGGAATDPTGLSFQVDTPSTGEVTATYGYTTASGASGTLTMVIRFFSQSGVQRTNIDFNSPVAASSLTQLIDNAASQLASDADPFLSGVWTVTGSDGLTGSGAEVGMIGGSSNDNELEEIRTISAASPGVPTASGSRTDAIADNDCSLSFGTTSLLTDQTTAEGELPEGTLSIALTRSAFENEPEVTVTGDVDFDGTSQVLVTVNRVGSPIRFRLDLVTLSIESVN